MKLLAKSFTDVYCFSTFFYPKLSNGGYKAVNRWAKSVDIVKQRLLLFPLHLEMHWCLAAVNIPECQISCYDSLGNDNQTCLENIQRYMTQRLCNTKLSSIKWHCVCHDDIPKQENLSDCGAFTCMFGRCLAYNSPLNFTQQDIPCIRRHIVLELLSRELIN